jgi:hypothetical protein
MGASAVPGMASTITRTAGVHPCISTSGYCTYAIGTFGAGTQVSLGCWMDGRTATGAYASNRWFLVRRGDGYEGFVHSSLSAPRRASAGAATRCG